MAYDGGVEFCREYVQVLPRLLANLTRTGTYRIGRFSDTPRNGLGSPRNRRLTLPRFLNFSLGASISLRAWY